MNVQPFLDRLGVRASSDQKGRARVAEVVEAETVLGRRQRSLDGRLELAPIEEAMLKRPASRAREDEVTAADGGQVLLEHFIEKGGERQATLRMGLRGTELKVAVDVLERAPDGQRAMERIYVRALQTSQLPCT
jgi:hypothetical protein